MLLDMILLGWMATSYKYVDYTTMVREDDKVTEAEKSKKKTDDPEKE